MLHGLVFVCDVCFCVCLFMCACVLSMMYFVMLYGVRVSVRSLRLCVFCFKCARSPSSGN